MTGTVLSQKLKRPPPRINLGKRLLNNRTSPPPTPIKGESPETYPYLRVGGGNITENPSLWVLYRLLTHADLCLINTKHLPQC